MGNKTVTFDRQKNQKSSPNYTYADVSLTSQTGKNGNYQITKKLDVDAVKGAVRNVFTWNQGERIILPEFGSNLRALLYEGITDLNSERIVAECQMLMTKWEPRAIIKKIYKKDSVEDQENNQVSIVILWYVAGLPETIYQEEVSV